uniref:Uncharacterized protein n=1 Tax=Oryza nivara TaxID=4536 RepID=A0A0E0IPP6_ORYNI
MILFHSTGVVFSVTSILRFQSHDNSIATCITACRRIIIVFVLLFSFSNPTKRNCGRSIFCPYPSRFLRKHFPRCTLCSCSGSRSAPSTPPRRRARHAAAAAAARPLRRRGHRPDVGPGVRPAAGLPRRAPRLQPRPHPRFLQRLPHRRLPGAGARVRRGGRGGARRPARVPLPLLPLRRPRRGRRRHGHPRGRVRQRRGRACPGRRRSRARRRGLRRRRPVVGDHPVAVRAGHRAVAAARAVQVRRLLDVVGHQPPARRRPWPHRAAHRVGGDAPHRWPLVGAPPRPALPLPAALPAAARRVARRRVHAVRAGEPRQPAPRRRARAAQLRRRRRRPRPPPRGGQHRLPPRHATRGALRARLEAPRRGHPRLRRALPPRVARRRAEAARPGQVRSNPREQLPRERGDLRFEGVSGGGDHVLAARRRGGHGRRGHRRGVPAGAVRGARGLDGAPQGGGVQEWREVDGDGGDRHGEPGGGGLGVRAVQGGRRLRVRVAGAGDAMGAAGPARIGGDDGGAEPQGGRVVGGVSQAMAAARRRHRGGSGRRAQAGHGGAARPRSPRAGGRRRGAPCEPLVSWAAVRLATFSFRHVA